MLVGQMGEDQGRVADVGDQACDHRRIERQSQSDHGEADQNAKENRSYHIPHVEDQLLQAAPPPFAATLNPATGAAKVRGSGRRLARVRFGAATLVFALDGFDVIEDVLQRFLL